MRISDWISDVCSADLLGNAVHDVEQHHVAEPLEPDEMRQGSADVASPDQGDLVPSHLSLLASPSAETPGSGRVNSAKYPVRQPQDRGCQSRSEENTSELQHLQRRSCAGSCLKK